MRKDEQYQKLFREAINMARAINANLGDTTNPSTLAYAWRERIDELEAEVES